MMLAFFMLKLFFSLTRHSLAPAKAEIVNSQSMRVTRERSEQMNSKKYNN